MATLIDYVSNGWAKLPEWAKAIVGGAGAALTYLIGAEVIDLSLNPVDAAVDTWQNLHAFTTQQWLALIGVTLGLGAGVWWTPNRDPQS